MTDLASVIASAKKSGLIKVREEKPQTKKYTQGGRADYVARERERRREFINLGLTCHGKPRLKAIRGFTYINGTKQYRREYYLKVQKPKRNLKPRKLLGIAFKPRSPEYQREYYSLYVKPRRLSRIASGLIAHANMPRVNQPTGIHRGLSRADYRKAWREKFGRRRFMTMQTNCTRSLTCCQV